MLDIKRWLGTEVDFVQLSGCEGARRHAADKTEWRNHCLGQISAMFSTAAWEQCHCEVFSEESCCLFNLSLTKQKSHF